MKLISWPTRPLHKWTWGPMGSFRAGGSQEGGPSLILSYRVAVSQKGLINLMLQVNTTPGHSSAPPKETSIGILTAAVNR